MILQNESYYNMTPDGTTPPNNPELVRNYNQLHIEDPWKYPNSNFLELFNKNTPIQNYGIEFNGGTEHVTYHAGLGYYNQKGIFDPVDYNRYNYNMNLEMRPTSSTKVGFSLYGAIERTNDIDADETTSGHLFRSFYKFLPTQSLIYPDGEHWGESSANSPVGVLRSNGYNRIDQNTLLGSIFVEQQILDGLSVKGVFSYDPTQINTKSFHVPFKYHVIDLSHTPYTFTEAVSLQEGSGRPYTWLGLENRRRANYTYQGYLNYNKSFGDHQLTGLLVAEARQYTEDWFGARRNNFSVEIDELSLGSSDRMDFDNGGLSSTGSEIGYVYRLGYSYKQKYMLEAAGRYDGHYYFAPGSQWGYFPSFSAAWRISEERFLNYTGSWLTEMKLRGSWGKAGMLAGEAFQYMTGYNLRGNAYAFGNGTLVQGARVLYEPNPNITWEISAKTNIGVDLSLWNNLLNIELDYFTEKRSGMLLAPQVTLPVEYGLALSQENKGEMKNKGFEINIGTRRNINEDFNLSFNANASYAKNSMVEVFETDAERNNPNRTKVGRPFGTPYGYKSLGLFSTADDHNGDGIVDSQDGYNVQQFGILHPGDIIYADLNGPNGVPDGNIDDYDLTVIGHPVYPAWTFGFTPSAEWKGLDLTLFFQGSAKSSINIRQFMTVPFENNGSNTAYEYYNNRWTPENQSAKYPRSTPAPYANNTKDSDFWMANTSYLRLKTASVGYRIPEKITKQWGIGSLRVYAIGQNLLTFSKLKYIDPEMGYSNRETSYPVMKSTTFGIELNF
jgi:TonB-linked SusC/RagA family outer membrane protein